MAVCSENAGSKWQVYAPRGCRLDRHVGVYVVAQSNRIGYGLYGGGPWWPERRGNAAAGGDRERDIIMVSSLNYYHAQ